MLSHITIVIHCERKMGIEPTSSVWKTDALTVVLHSHFFEKQDSVCIGVCIYLLNYSAELLGISLEGVFHLTSLFCLLTYVKNYLCISQCQSSLWNCLCISQCLLEFQSPMLSCNLFCNFIICLQCYLQYYYRY